MRLRTVFLTMAVGIVPLLPLSVGAAPAGAAVSHLPSATGSISCAGLRGSISFSPALTNTTKSETVTFSLSSPQCTPASASSRTTSVVLSSSQVHPGLSCTTLGGSTANYALKATWSPAVVATSTVTFPGFFALKGPTGGGAFAFPKTRAGTSASGSYAGTNAGTLSNLYAESSLTAASMVASCKGAGLTAIPVATGLVTLGDSSAAFTSGSTASFTEGTHGNFPVTVSTGVAAKITWSGALPPGLVFVNAGPGSSAQIDGTPLVGTAGAYPVTATVIDQDGQSASQVITITVLAINPAIPLIASVTNNDGTSGRSALPAQTMTITGSNLATVSDVKIGDVAGAITSQTATTLVFKVPNVEQGTYDVTVDSSAGTSPLSLDDRIDVRNVPRQPAKVQAWAEGKAIHATWAPNPLGDNVTSWSLTAAPTSGYVAKPGSLCTSPIVISLPSATTVSADVPTGACAGVPFELTLVASNVEGSSAASSPSDSTTAMSMTTPSGPVITHVSAGNKSLKVFWAAPPWNGGSTLLAYDLKVTHGTTAITVHPAASATSVVVGGLTNAYTYKVSLVARNAVGASAASTSSGTPTATPVPDAPSSLLVRPAGSGTALSVTWSAPTFSNVAIGGYVLRLTPVAQAGVKCRASVVQGLAAGWTVPATLHVNVPACAAGFSAVSISGASYDAVTSPLGSVAIVLKSNGGTSGTTSAIPVGALVNFDTQIVTGTTKTSMLAASTTSMTLTGLSASASYLVTVAAKSASGTGAAITSTNPVTPTVSLAPRAKVLSQTTMNSLLFSAPQLGALDTRYVWPASAPAQVASVHAGDTLIAPSSEANPQAVLILVQSVSHDGDGQLVIDATPADATDAYNTFSFSFTGNPPVQGASSHTALSAARGSHLSIPISIHTGNVDATGSISVTPSVNAGASHWCTASVWPGVCYQWGISASASATITLAENVNLNLHGATTVSIFNCNVGNGCFQTITFWIGPIPVVISPSVAVSIDLSGSVNIHTEASTYWTGWIAYNSGSGFSSGSNHSSSVTPGQNYVNGTAHAQLNAQFQICTYGDLICGSLNGSAAVDLAFNSAVIAPANYLTVTCSVNANAAFSVHFFGWHPSGSANLFNWSAQCYHITAAPGIKVLTISTVALPGYPVATVPLGAAVVTLSAARNDLATPTLSWSLIGAVSGNGCADSITNSGVLTTGCVGNNRSLTIRAIDTSAAPQLVAYRTVTVQSGYVFNPPGPPSAFSTPIFLSNIRNVSIFLTPPVNSGGYGMWLYYVYFSCPVLSWQAYGPQGIWVGYTGALTILHVQTFGWQYCHVTVWPINLNSAWGPPSSADLFI